MIYVDTILGCRGCKNDFVFTADEQAQRFQQGLTTDPEFCPDCRTSPRFTRSGGRGRFGERERAGGDRGERVMHTAVCSVCGVETTIPFVPSQDRPVYCASCYQAHRETRGERAR